jgi:hypothetical protein
MRLGLPDDWAAVHRWLNPASLPPIPKAGKQASKPKKCPEIATLPSYRAAPSFRFWKTFPSAPLPTTPKSHVDTDALRQAVDTVAAKLSVAQLRRADTLLKELSTGAAVPFSRDLPAMITPNTPSVAAHGEEFTDRLADWVKKGYVAGPFVTPPMPGFRSNAMIAVEQKDKIRIIMNLSAPDGQSFNDAIDEQKLEKVRMSTARTFGYSVADCGPGARMWKWDQVDAYKNVPARLEDLKYQGFAWLNRYFVETQQAFGSKAAVAAYDRLGHTMADIATVSAGTPHRYVHRTLDDLPLVTPATSPAGPAFARKYAALCKNIGIRLAPPCPDKEKSFEDSTYGTVLGIVFDTVLGLWSISRAKFCTIATKIQTAVVGGDLTLTEMQQLLGSLNDFGQMCPILNAFRLPLLLHLAAFKGNEEIIIPLPQPARRDLLVWAAAAESATRGLPIPHRPIALPMRHLQFVSDAAGAPFAKRNGTWVPYGTAGDKGVASVGYDEDRLV